MKKLNIKITSAVPKKETSVEEKTVEAAKAEDKPSASAKTSTKSQGQVESVSSQKTVDNAAQQQAQGQVTSPQVLSRFSQLAFRLDDKYASVAHIKSVEGKNGDCVVSTTILNPPHIKNLATTQIMGQPAGEVCSSCAYLLSGAALVDLFTEITKCAVAQGNGKAANAQIMQVATSGDFPQFFRITSPFQTQRPHPVYGVRLGHFGVDFVPVRAFCDGMLRWFKASDFSTLCLHWAKKYFGVKNVEGARCERTSSTNGGTQLVYVLPGICRIAIAHLYTVPARTFRSSMDSGVRLKGGWSLCPPATDDVCEDFSSNEALYCMGDSGAATAPHIHCSVVISRSLLA